MTAIRGLLERNLLERAVALAETRWPGSGPVVELAHEWAVLSPGARRERLASIGPEDLARLRGLSQLNPDLARVLSDLEARGIIPPDGAADVRSAEHVAAQGHLSFEEAVVDTALDYSEQGMQRLAASAREDLPPFLEAAVETIGADTPADVVAEAAALVARNQMAPHPMRPVKMPELDLGLPSTEEVLAQEAEKRRQASAVADAILERARLRVEATADGLLPTSHAIRSEHNDRPAVAPSEISGPRSAPAIAPNTHLTAQQSTRVDSIGERDLLAMIEDTHVLEFASDDQSPSAADLHAAATSSDLDYVDLDRSLLGMREFFGGLVREGRRVEPRAGAFPLAASRRSLVVVRGRLSPRLIERLRAGFCDIPGTQATVLVHPDCRIVLLSD